MKTKYFTDCQSLEEIKKRYKQLALKYHPDRPDGNTEIMQEINREYEEIIQNPEFYCAEIETESEEEVSNFPEIIGKIIAFDVVIEICGNWIWVSGNTFPYRKELKEAGFFFSTKKKMWYFRPEDYKSNNRDSMPMDSIRKKYGSDFVEREKPNVLAE